MKPLDNKQQEIGKYSICLPSISTAAYQFDIERAAKVATKVIKEFLESRPNADIQIYLVDIRESTTLDAFRKFKEEEIDDPRYVIQPANLTLLRDYRIPSRYIVNASNPSFHGTGSGTNKAIHDAANFPQFNLEKETRKLYSKKSENCESLSCGLAGWVSLERIPRSTHGHSCGRAKYVPKEAQIPRERLRKRGAIITGILQISFKYFLEKNRS